MTFGIKVTALLILVPALALAQRIVIDVREDAPANAVQAIVATLNSEWGNSDTNGFLCINTTHYAYTDGTLDHAMNSWDSAQFGTNEAFVLARVDKMSQRGTPWIGFAVVADITEYCTQLEAWGLVPKEPNE